MVMYIMPPGYIRMSDWNVVKIDGLGSFHIAGIDIAERQWRISTEIVELDLEKLTAKTRSGSVYSFTEPRGEMHRLVLNALDTYGRGKYSHVDDETLKALAPKPSVETGEEEKGE
jgi:hypothetical protein